MSVSHTLDELNRAAAAAGYAMAAVDDEADLAVVKSSGDEVARGARVPTAQSVLAALPAPRRGTDTSRGFLAGANTVRDTVYGYLGLGGATA